MWSNRNFFRSQRVGSKSSNFQSSHFAVKVTGVFTHLKKIISFIPNYKQCMHVHRFKSINDATVDIVQFLRHSEGTIDASLT